MKKAYDTNNGCKKKAALYIRKTLTLQRLYSQRKSSEGNRLMYFYLCVESLWAVLTSTF